MKKIFKALLVLLLISGCASQNSEGEANNDVSSNDVVVEGYNILVPSGAPALAVVNDIVNSEINTYTITSGADLLTTELAKSDSEYDIIVAPINAGSKLISLGKSEYKLSSVLTWGNLYLVGTEDASETDAISAFGEAAVPGMVFKNLHSKLNMSNEVTYYSAVTEAQAALLGGKTKLALLAEPAVTATIAKAKQSGINLAVKKDLQKLWEEAYGSYGYPQAAIFVKNSVYEANPASVNHYLDTISKYISDADMTLFEASVDAKLEEIGVPSAKVAVNSYERQNIEYKKAIDVKENIDNFLEVFNINLSEEGYIK